MDKKLKYLSEALLIFIFIVIVVKVHSFFFILIFCFRPLFRILVCLFDENVDYNTNKNVEAIFHFSLYDKEYFFTKENGKICKVDPKSLLGINYRYYGELSSIDTRKNYIASGYLRKYIVYEFIICWTFMVISHTFLGLNNLILMLFISFYSFSIISILGNNIKGKTHNYHPLKLKEYFITFDDLQSMKKKYTLYSIDQYYDIYLCNTNYKYFAQILQKMVSGGNYDA